MNKFLLSLAASLLLARVVFAQVPEAGYSRRVLVPAKPEEAGMSSERLSRLDRTLEQYIDQGRIPGAVVLVARHGKIIHYKGLGMKDGEKKEPMQKDDIFRIASQTKAITSVAVMMLYEEGRFLLDDPVAKYIPEFRKPVLLDKFNEKDSSYTTRPAQGEVTIRHLLTHTSGIGYGFTNPKLTGAVYAKAGVPDLIGAAGMTLKDRMKVLAGLPLLHNPGEKFTYGLSVDMLGYLVEVLSGQNLADFFRQRIFEPLAMRDTYFYLPLSKGHRLVMLHGENQEGKAEKLPERRRGLPRDFPLAPEGSYFSGGGGLSSTALDYAVFLQMMLNGGEYNGQRLLSRKTVDLMLTNQIDQLSLGPDKFGLGFSVATDKSSARFPVSVGTFAWGGAFGTTYWADPREEIIALLLTQVYPSRAVGEAQDKFRVLVYQAIVD
ncbi:MAG: beta-lactamase family protein [Ferruginibacter sp.]|nr:beta-lactamase family protein [Cytophagales bacterium]